MPEAPRQDGRSDDWLQPAATDDVTDLIASIEMHRQELERDTGLEASRSYALGRLHEALLSEQVPANLEALGLAIKRIRALGSRTIQRATLKAMRPAQSQKSWRSARRHSPKTRGRRTTGQRSCR